MKVGQNIRGGRFVASELVKQFNELAARNLNGRVIPRNYFLGLFLVMTWILFGEVLQGNPLRGKIHSDNIPHII